MCHFCFYIQVPAVNGVVTVNYTSDAPSGNEGSGERVVFSNSFNYTVSKYFIYIYIYIFFFF